MSHIIEIPEDYGNCPYYKQDGSEGDFGPNTCNRGCVEEPICQTNEPPEGWGGYWVTTPNGVTAHVTGEPTDNPETRAAIDAVIEAAYKLFTEESNDG